MTKQSEIIIMTTVVFIDFFQNKVHLKHEKFFRFFPILQWKNNTRIVAQLGKYSLLLMFHYFFLLFPI